MDGATAFMQAALGDALALDRDVQGCTATDVTAPTPGLYLFNSGRCINTSTFFYDAVSPAFTSDYRGLRSDRKERWSTWTESRWDSLKIRMFLIANPKHDVRRRIKKMKEKE